MGSKAAPFLSLCLQCPVAEYGQRVSKLGYTEVEWRIESEETLSWATSTFPKDPNFICFI